VKPEFYIGIDKDLKKYFDQYHTMNMENFKIREDEIAEGGRGKVIVQACEGRREKTE
jgi:formylmethanofuran dehydrogenase subunit A